MTDTFSWCWFARTIHSRSRIRNAFLYKCVKCTVTQRDVLQCNVRVKRVSQHQEIICTVLCWHGIEVICGMVWNSLAWFGMVWHHVARYGGMVWHRNASYDKVLHRITRNDTQWHGMEWQCIEMHGTASHGVVLHSMTCNDMAWYRMAKYVMV